MKALLAVLMMAIICFLGCTKEIIVQPSSEENPKNIQIPYGSLSVNPDTLPYTGGIVQLSWAISKASFVYLGNRPVSAVASEILSVSTSTIFTLTCQNEDTVVSFRDTVIVLNRDIISVTFRFDESAGSCRFFTWPFSHYTTLTNGMVIQFPADSVFGLDIIPNSGFCLDSLLANGIPQFIVPSSQEHGVVVGDSDTVVDIRLVPIHNNHKQLDRLKFKQYLPSTPIHHILERYFNATWKSSRQSRSKASQAPSSEGPT